MRLACWFRRRAETGFPLNFSRNRDVNPQRKFTIARTHSPARVAHALPRGVPLPLVVGGLLFIFRRRRGDELLEARIIPERIEHRIEPEQCKRERRVRSQWATAWY
jgi:hypothetical protein